MTISAGIKTPGIYTDVNINTLESILAVDTKARETASQIISELIV